MSSDQHFVSRRGIFGLLGTAVLVGTGVALVVRDANSQEAPGQPAAGGTPGGEPHAPDGKAQDPHVIDPSLDEGPEPGELTSQMAARVADAIDAAASEGVELTVNSGWRSAAYQEGLFLDAIAEHGSEDAARQWVLPPDESMHVRGLAVDVGPPDAAAWLAAHGWRFGLCQRYENEPWHFEPITAPGGECPSLQPDSASA